jgi:hypothetical protein
LSTSRRRTTSSAFRSTRSVCSRSTTTGPTSCCRHSARTRLVASSKAVCGTSRSAARARQSRRRGTRPGRHVRDARQLPSVPTYSSGATYGLCSGRTSVTWRQASCASLRLLAGDAHVGGVRGPAADLRPRVPAAGRAKDLEVDRKRDRSAGSRRCVRARCGSLLGDSLRVVRPGRSGLARRRARALRTRARERPGNPFAHDRDDRAPPRRQLAVVQGWSRSAPSSWASTRRSPNGSTSGI